MLRKLTSSKLPRPNETALTWGIYGDGKHNLAASPYNKATICTVGNSGKIHAFWMTNTIGSIRSIVIPDGEITLTFNSDNTVDIQGTKSGYEVREILFCPTWYLAQ